MVLYFPYREFIGGDSPLETIFASIENKRQALLTKDLISHFLHSLFLYFQFYSFYGFVCNSKKVSIERTLQELSL